MSRTSILVCSVFSAASITLAPGTSAHALPGSHFGWGQGQDGWGHCYEYASSGGVLNEGQPVSDSFCGRVVFRWGQGQDGWTHCYEYGGPYVVTGAKFHKVKFEFSGSSAGSMSNLLWITLSFPHLVAALT